MKLLVLSDIHGNREALREILDYAENTWYIDICVLLGDVIDYGMHSNEVVQMLRDIKYPIICNIWGNHEFAIFNEDYVDFSSDRGRWCAQYTRSILNDRTWEYIRNVMTNSGVSEFVIEGKKCLAVHGSLAHIYWKSIKADQELSEYKEYDYVFSGHSHLPHYFEIFYEADDPHRRNKKKTIFINPGSVGQPRNLNAMAQCVVLDTETGSVTFEKVPYDIKKEQEAYNGQVDDFYRERLEVGV
ncbi:MAG: metallophosphoesterase family protein [Lachnospiraceae bacterium]|nr:metallophosphoesterase family protein [Lachnospiraceae bacterium]